MAEDMQSETIHGETNPLRIGAVNYLNTKPLVYGLAERLPGAKIVFDFPSRLADRLSAGELDVALVPSVALADHPEWSVVSDACIGCQGPVLSVKLLFRVAPERVRTLALDEGSRTSAVLAQILLFQLHGVRPQLTSLPIGESPAGVAADAVLVIGDRAMRDDLPAGGENGQHAGGKRQASGEVSQPPFCQVWDLGEQWTAWSQLPFVFAMWIARPGVPRAEVAAALSAARDAGEQQLPEIARQQAAALQLPEPLVHDYLSRNLHFHLDKKQRQGLELFYRQAALFGLVAAVPQVDFDDCPTESC